LVERLATDVDANRACTKVFPRSASALSSLPRRRSSRTPPAIAERSPRTQMKNGAFCVSRYPYYVSTELSFRTASGDGIVLGRHNFPMVPRLSAARGECRRDDATGIRTTRLLSGLETGASFCRRTWSHGGARKRGRQRGDLGVSRGAIFHPS